MTLKRRGRYLKRRVIKKNKDRVVLILNNILSYFEGSEEEEIEVSGLYSNIQIWNGGSPTVFVRWLRGECVIENIGYARRSTFCSAVKKTIVRRKVLEELLQRVKESNEKNITLVP